MEENKYLKNIWMEIKTSWKEKKEGDAEKIIRNLGIMLIFLLTVYCLTIAFFVFIFLEIFTDRSLLSSLIFSIATPIMMIISIFFCVCFFKVTNKKEVIVSFMTSTTLIWMSLSLEIMLKNMPNFKILLNAMTIVSIVLFSYYFLTSALEVLFRALKLNDKIYIPLTIFIMLFIIFIFFLGFRDPLLLIF